jgi:hypothetical protein
MTWITIADAAKLAGRSQRTIYNWINAGRLAQRYDDLGRKCVESVRLLEVEATVQRGRPVGSVSLR